MDEWTCRCNNRKYYCWAKKLMLCKNWTSQKKPAIRYSLETGDLNHELHVVSQTLFWFLFFSSSLALRSKRTGTDDNNCDQITSKFAYRWRLIKSLLGKPELKRELSGKSSWSYKSLRFLQKALQSFDCSLSVAIERLEKSGAIDCVKKTIFCCKLLILYWRTLWSIVWCSFLWYAISGKSWLSITNYLSG